MKRIWFKGKRHTGTLAISAHDRGLTLGDGLFETLLVVKDVALWRFEHLRRMKAAATELGMVFPEEEIENAIDALTHRSKSHHVLRLTLTRGEGGRGLAGESKAPNFLATLDPFDPALQFQPVTLKTSGICRNASSPASRLKTLSYMDNILAARDAVADGFDDALMLNSEGRVACTTIGNIFLERGGMLITPALGEGLLPGVTRAAVIAAAASHANIKVEERQVTLADVEQADGLFVTNSLRYLRPVSRLDQRKFKTGRHAMRNALVRHILQGEQEQILLN